MNIFCCANVAWVDQIVANAKANARYRDQYAAWTLLLRASWPLDNDPVDFSVALNRQIPKLEALLKSGVRFMLMSRMWSDDASADDLRDPAIWARIVTNLQYEAQLGRNLTGFAQHALDRETYGPGKYPYQSEWQLVERVSREFWWEAIAACGLVFATPGRGYWPGDDVPDTERIIWIDQVGYPLPLSLVPDWKAVDRLEKCYALAGLRAMQGYYSEALTHPTTAFTAGLKQRAPDEIMLFPQPASQNWFAKNFGRGIGFLPSTPDAAEK